MKRTARYFINIIIASVLLSGCNEFFPSNGHFVVDHVESLSDNLYKYTLVSLKGDGLLFIKDSANKYIIGDTVILVPLHNR